MHGAFTIGAISRPQNAARWTQFTDVQNAIAVAVRGACDQLDLIVYTVSIAIIDGTGRTWTKGRPGDELAAVDVRVDIGQPSTNGRAGVIDRNRLTSLVALNARR